jgi:lipoate-protein ligase A
MSHVLAALQNQVPDASLQGTCDLTWQDRKCSGNSLRIARRHLLYHGTILHDFDLPLMASCLRAAPRQPAYRRGRDHRSFVTNVPLDPATFAIDLAAILGVQQETDIQPLRSRIRRLRDQRYDAPEWHFRH